MDDSAVICDEVIDADAESSDSKLSQEDAKISRRTTTKQLLMKRKQPAKRKISIFYLHFY